MTVFDCPECEHRSTHWTTWTGAIAVFWHFYREHPDMSARAGNPLDPESGPTVADFEGDDGGEQ